MARGAESAAMRCIVDQSRASLAAALRHRGIEADTATKLILGHEDSRVRVPDPKILSFLRARKDEYVLVTGDSDLAEYCAEENFRHVYAPDPVDIEWVLARLQELQLG